MNASRPNNLREETFDLGVIFYDAGLGESNLNLLLLDHFFDFLELRLEADQCRSSGGLLISKLASTAMAKGAPALEFLAHRLQVFLHVLEAPAQGVRALTQCLDGVAKG